MLFFKYLYYLLSFLYIFKYIHFTFNILHLGVNLGFSWGFLGVIVGFLRVIMDKQFYISSTKFSIKERQTKNYGKVYDIRFRIIDKNGVEIHKKLSGFANKTLAKQGHTDFITNY